MTQRPDRHDFIPALRFGWLTRAYDPIVRVTTRERRFRRSLLTHAQLRPGQRVLDVGAGTGSLLALLRAQSADTALVGIDVDSVALALASAKPLGGAGLAQAIASELPFADRSFDHAFITLVLHHLDDRAKDAALAEIHRVLRPGGTLHVADWRRGTNPLLQAAFLSVRALDGAPTTRDHAHLTLAEILARGDHFESVLEYEVLATPLGSIGLAQATA